MIPRLIHLATHSTVIVMTDMRQSEYPIDPLFTERWSPRAFSGESIAEDVLMTLLEAARWAPSSYNAQPWRFVYVRRETPGWKPVFDTLVEFNRSWAQRASALVVIVSAKEAVFPGSTESELNPWHSFDAGAAWASLAFQATLLGWAAHGMAGFDADQLRQAVQVPEGYAIEAVVAIGKRADKSVLPAELQSLEAPNGRLPLAQLVAEGTFRFEA